MRLAMLDDSNCSYATADGGCITNISGDPVLLYSPTSSELTKAFAAFSYRLRDGLKAIFASKWSEISERYGQLDLRASRNKARTNELYGLISSGERPKYHLLRPRAITQACVELGHLPRYTPHGKLRKNNLSGEGNIAEKVQTLTMAEQRAILHYVIDGDLDDCLRQEQAATLGWNDLEGRVARSRSPDEVLLWLVSELDAHINERMAVGRVTFKGRGSGYNYAPIWFCFYLASIGVWLLPPVIMSHIKTLMPRRYWPLLAWIAVTEDVRLMADRALSLHTGSKETTTRQYSANVFITISLCSTAWEVDQFQPAPLVCLKQLVAGASSDSINAIKSGSINNVYRFLLKEFAIAPEIRPEAALFFQKKKLRSATNDPFHWCFYPRPKNTEFARKCIKKEVVTVPRHVQSWALILRDVLRFIEQKSMPLVIRALNCWLVFLLTLSEEDAPRTMADIERAKHVNSLGRTQGTYCDFLETLPVKDKHFHNRAISKMLQAWSLLATRDGFAATKSNPFDASLDFSKAGGKRKPKTPRDTLREPIANLIMRENRRDNFAFARAIPELWTDELDGSGKWRRIFWPILPIILEIIFATGMRKGSAKWLDSGEGDEYDFDRSDLEPIKNRLSTATPGRQEFFLRPKTLDDVEQTRALAIYRPTDKIAPAEVLWCSEDIANDVTELRKLQEEFRPIKAPVRAVDQRNITSVTNLELYPLVYPLFRDPKHAFVDAISDAKIWSYYVALLKHCEPIIKKELGLNYPLFTNGKARHDIHSWRATVVTLLRGKGVSASTVMHLTGHKSFAMMLHYDKPDDHVLHAELRDALAYNETIDSASEGNVEALMRIADEMEMSADANPEVARVIRAVANGSMPSCLDFFNHGICVGGDCSKGLVVNGKRAQAVWRPRACSHCIFRATGPLFMPGLLNRVNILMWELRSSAKRSERFNREIEEIEKNSGRPATGLRRQVQTEDVLRRNLEAEYHKEIETCKRYEPALLNGLSRSASQTRRRGERRALDPDSVSLRVQEVPEFKHLHLMVEALDALPSSRFDLPLDVEHQYRETIRTILRANSLDDVMESIPQRKERAHLLGVGSGVPPVSPDIRLV